MKRFLVFIAVALVLAVAAPVMAGPFSDVPQDHWAYSALEKLQATGIITGYADGTFQGKNTLTRYEIAVIVSRILDQVAAERALLSEKVDALENGLTAGQAEDVIAIFKSLMAKDEEVATQPTEQPSTVVEKVIEKETEVVFPETLTDAQAAEVAAIVEALTMEFKFELQALGAKVDALTTKVDGIDARVAALEAKPVTWKGWYELKLNRTFTEGPGQAFFDPFKKEYDGSVTRLPGGTRKYDAGYDSFAAQDVLQHKLNLGANVQVNDLTGVFNLTTVVDPFYKDATVNWNDLSAKVSGNGLTAVMDRGQTNVWTSFLFGLDDPYTDLYNGLKVSYGKDEYVYFNTGAEKLLAAKKSLGLFDTTLYVATPDVMVSKDFVAGIVTPVDLFVDFTTTAAVQKDGDDYLKYVTVNGKKAFGPLTLEGNYTLNKDGFQGYYKKGLKTDGYDGKANLALFNNAVKLNGRYADYNGYKFDTRYGAGAELALGGLTAKFDQDYAQKGTDKSDRTQASVDFEGNLSFLSLNAGYQYDQYTDNIRVSKVDDNGNPKVDENGNPITRGNIYVAQSDEFIYELSKWNNAYATLEAKLFGGLSAAANYTYGMKGDAYGEGLYTHDYSLNWEYNILNAGFTYDVAGDMMVYSAGVDPKALNVVGVSIDPVASITYNHYNDGSTPEMDYKLGVDVKKALTAKSNLTYSYLLNERQIYAGTNVLEGKLEKHVVKADYALAKDLTVNASYTNMDFAGENAANSYKAQELKTYLKFAF